MTMFTIQNAIEKLVQKRALTAEEMRTVMWEILSDGVTPAQLGGFLVAMRMKGETVDELVAAVQVLKELAVKVPMSDPTLVDIVGTGGDSAHTFNISTCSAFVVAAAGGKVAKHGNRSVSSHSGSADVLEAAGVTLTLTPEQIAQCVEKTGVGFMYAPEHHAALKNAFKPRKELGIRTLFNLIGPLTNPANVKRQLVGVFAKQWLLPIAQVLQRLGSDRALIVHAEDGLDEISINAPTHIAELNDGQIKTYMITPEQFGFSRTALENIQVKNAQESLAMIKWVLKNQPGPARDIVALNAGAAIYIAGLTDTLAEGVQAALQALASGAAYARFTALREVSPGAKSKKNSPPV